MDRATEDSLPADSTTTDSTTTDSPPLSAGSLGVMLVVAAKIIRSVIAHILIYVLNFAMRYRSTGINILPGTGTETGMAIIAGNGNGNGNLPGKVNREIKFLKFFI